MSRKEKVEQSAETKDVKAETCTDENNGHPNCEGQPCDNVSDESFDATDNTAQLTAEITLWKDKYARLSAEFDNYRKRTLKEKMDLVSTAGEDVIKSLLVVIDDFDRALSAIESSGDAASVKQGVGLISQKFNDVLRSKGVKEIDAIGLPLDTDLHEAVAKMPVEGEQKGKIIDIVQKGYKLNDKVIRYAKVVVGE